MDYWFPPVYRALPTGLWMVLLAVAATFAVWQWVEYFAQKRRG